uniref:Proline dehydrogenase n=1 Tax=Astyanax mexicanus TaxID=7994 RepID=A0A8B9HN70_ASTMX
MSYRGTLRACARLGRLRSRFGSPGVSRCGSRALSSSSPAVSVDFEESREAYRSKATLELIRNLLVLKICSYDVLVDHNKEIMDLSRTLLGQKGFEQLMKMTFYGQFVAGEDHQSIRPLIQKNMQFGVGAVLDYSHLKKTTLLLSGGSSEDGFTAIKMTALGRPQFLVSAGSEHEFWVQRRFRKGSDVPYRTPSPVTACRFLFPPFYRCSFQNVRLMVDAEQTYFQPAISRLTLETQRSFNTHRPVIFNTYQCYLKEAYDNVSMDVELSRREGWCFGAKLVRGAYMDQERRRAAEMENLQHKLTNISCSPYLCWGITSGWGIVNWGEKQDKINKIKKITYNFLALYLQFKIKFSVCVCLGQAGFPVYKYVPYGPVSEVIPYLSRRAQENRGVMKGAQAERELLWSELVRRLTSGEIFNTQSL